MPAREAIDRVLQPVIYSYLTHGEGNFNREKAHERFLKITGPFEHQPSLRKALHRATAYRSPRLETTLFGKTLPHPYGVSAGIDKNFQRSRFLGEGADFSFVTGGTLTLDEYPGNNTYPRIQLVTAPSQFYKRLESLLNSLGYPNLGIPGNYPVIAEKWPRVKAGRTVDSSYLRIISMSANKRSFEAGTAVEDIIATHFAMLPFGDVDEIGFSPNTPQTFGLLSPETFARLLKEFGNNWEAFLSSMKADEQVLWNTLGPKPLTFKLGPDLTEPHYKELVQALIEHGAKGVTAANTTQDKDTKVRWLGNPDYPGGLSGASITDLAQEKCELLAELDPEDRLVKLFGGGLMNTFDDWNRISAARAHGLGVLSAYVLPTPSSLFFTFLRNRQLDQALKVAGVDSLTNLRGSRKIYPFNPSHLLL